MLDFYEDFMVEQRSKMLRMMQVQKQRFGRRNTEELCKLIQPLLKEDYTKSSKEVEVVSLCIRPILQTFIPMISETVYSSKTAHGLNLANSLIRVPELASLRTLGVSIHVKGHFNGASDLLIITRCGSLSDPSNAVVRISKVMKRGKSFRYFLYFGTCKSPNNEFIVLKSQELPNKFQNLVNLKVIDNGDNVIHFKAKFANKEYFQTNCELFVPTLEDFPVILAGTSFCVKQLHVKQVRRKAQTYRISKKEEECCIIQ